MSGILYVCGTPIGNLEDLSFRTLRILKEVDFIAAEDTRHTVKLLNFYDVTTSLISYHEHNKAEKGPHIIRLLQEDKNVALVTDAGMPGISDPGEDLIRLSHEYGITVTSSPGPTAVTTAVALSGLSTRKFIFEGFLPQNKKDRKEILSELKEQQRTIVFYEAPHHLVKTLQDIEEIIGKRKLALIRELTKKFEEILHFETGEALEYFKTAEPKGEYVIVLEGMSASEAKENRDAQWEDLSVIEHYNQYVAQGLDRKAAMKAVAKDRGVSKSVVYAEFLKD